MPLHPRNSRHSHVLRDNIVSQFGPFLLSFLPLLFLPPFFVPLVLLDLGGSRGKCTFQFLRVGRSPAEPLTRVQGGI